MAAKTAEPRLYDLIEERAVLEPDGLPSPETLKEAWDTLHATREFLIEPIVRAVIDVGNESKPNTVTYEEIGRLLTWADNVRQAAEYITEECAKIVVVAYDLDVQADGYDGDGTMFSGFGHPDNRGKFRAAAARHGFDIEARDAS
jgi:hypothetical protein